MNDEETRRWAEEFIDWNVYKGLALFSPDTELCEGVRQTVLTIDISIAHQEYILGEWYDSGPLAFIRAVRDVVDENKNTEVLE